MSRVCVCAGAGNWRVSSSAEAPGLPWDVPALLASRGDHFVVTLATAVVYASPGDDAPQAWRQFVL